MWYALIRVTTAVAVRWPQSRKQERFLFVQITWKGCE